ncbi:MAG: radical SAM protein [Spirochaetes bacterium]|nr:radical SAM protein [Spirochaetota bacterium]
MTSEAATLLTHCTLCPRECGTDRIVSPGLCGATGEVMVNIYRLHHWEEPVLSGTRGSGTIFFSNCTMRCAYCQNWRISHEGRGNPRTLDDLCAMMLNLQAQGAHNVNLVSASQYTPLVAEAIRMARERELEIPVLWNSNAYEKPETLRLLDGLVDIYLPDFRYWDSETAERYSGILDYAEWARRAILEMHRQAGRCVIQDGIARKGLIIRLLVLPGQVAPIRDILKWIRDALGAETWISLMGQYYPVHRSKEFPEINRQIKKKEYEQCAGYLDDLGFENGFIQEVGSCADYTPEFAD